VNNILLVAQKRHL